MKQSEKDGEYVKFYFQTLADIKEISTFATAIERDGNNKDKKGALVQLVRIHACHAWGHGFESRTHRTFQTKARQSFQIQHNRRFFFIPPLLCYHSPCLNSLGETPNTLRTYLLKNDWLEKCRASAISVKLRFGFRSKMMMRCVV